MENYMICNCKQVSYFDVENAMLEGAVNAISSVGNLFKR